MQYLLTLQVSRNCLLPFKSIVIHEIRDKSGRTCWMTLKSHSTHLDYSGNVVSIQVDQIKTQGEIASYKNVPRIKV